MNSKNKDKYLSYSQKIKEQENKEKLVNSPKFDKNYSPLKVTQSKKDRLPTIQERETENFSIKPLTEEKEIDDIIIKQKMKNSANNQTNSIEANINKSKDSKERLEKSVKFDVTLPSNEVSPTYSNNPNKLINNNNYPTSVKNYPQNNVAASIKNKNLIINSINDTIDQKNNHSLRQPHYNDKIKTNVINSIQDTLTEHRNINNQPIRQRTNKPSKINSQSRKVNTYEIDNAEIELLEESLVKSLTGLNKMNDGEYIKNRKVGDKKALLKHEIYNGLIDRVSSYNFVSKEWSQIAFLNKTRSSAKLNTNHTTNTFESEKMQNVRAK